MNKTAISWSNRTWNAIHGCSKVSDGCKHCYAMKLSLDNGWTKHDWTIQHEAENVLMKPHKLAEPYTLTEPERIFVNSMSDMFHRAVPDWYRAVMFCVMLDLPQHVFQVLTKRSDALASWDERFLAAVRSDEFKQFAATVKQKKVKAALERAHEYASPWADHIWQGVSVEDGRVLHRIEDLRRSNAHVRFISAEPLLGAWGDAVDLSGIHWVIVGGESGEHMVYTDENGKRAENEKRWMKQEWAREIKRLCVDQGTAYFYKQDSGYRTEQRKYLVEEDGSMWEWAQYPGSLTPPREVGNPKSLFGNWDHKTEETSFNLRSYIAHLWESRAYQLEGFRAENAAIAAAWWYKALEELHPAPPTVPDPITTNHLEAERAGSDERIEDLIADLPAAVDVTPLAPKPTVTWDNLIEPAPQTTVANFQDVKSHWDRTKRQWDDGKFVYIGRYSPAHNLPGHLLANPFKIGADTPEARTKALEQYRAMLTERLADPVDGPKYRAALDNLRGKTCVCWCAPKGCHGDIIGEFLGETVEAHHEHAEPPQPEQPPVQMSLFGDEVPAKKKVYA